MSAHPDLRKKRSTRLTLLLLLASAAFGGWLVARHTLRVGSVLTDGERSFEVSPAVRSAVWETAEPLALPEVEGALVEGRATISPDGRLLVFQVGERGNNAELFVAERRESGWSTPAPLVELNSDADDVAPSFGPDGLYFASDRGPLERGLDLWRASWDQLGFDAPERLVARVQSDGDDTEPAVAPDGRLVFASTRVGGQYDLFEFDGVDVRPLDELNTLADERDPAISGAGSVLWFASNRSGDHDPYQSYRGRASWLPPARVAELATTADDRGPWVEPDGFSLLLWRDDADDASFWTARSREIYELPPPAVGWRELALLAALLILAALAWASRHYDGLTIVTRCLLASLLLHLALAWWLQHVHPDPVPFVGTGDEVRYAVTLVPESGEGRPEGRSTSRGQAGPARTARRQAEARPMARAEAIRARSRATDERATVVNEVESVATEATVAVTLPELERAEPVFAQAAQPSPSLRGRARSSARSESAPKRTDLRREPVRDVANVSAVHASASVRRPASDRGVTRAEARPEVAPMALAGGSPEAAVSLPEVSAPSPMSAEELGVQAERSNPVAFAQRRRERTEGPARQAFVRPQRHAPTPEAEALARNVVDSETPNTVALESSSASTRLNASVELPGLGREPGPTAQVSGHGDEDRLRGLAPTRFERRRREPLEGPVRRQRRRTSAPLVASVEDIERRAAEPTATPPVTTLAPVYQNRFGAERERALVRFGGDERTERSVRNGLRYLAKRQRQDGGWGRRHRDDKYGDVRIGKSGLALLAFLGAGHLPGGDTEHADVVDRAIDYLVAEQTPEGHFGRSNAYGHGIATYALAEAYALQPTERIRVPLGHALQHLIDFQTSSPHPHLQGGWSYFGPRSSGHEGDRWPRVSVTAWQVMALKSAENSGFRVPSSVLDDARKFLLQSWDQDMGAYRYSHSPERLRERYSTLPASTPAALFALSLLGEDVSSERFEDARRYLTERLPRNFSMRGNDAFIFRGDGNLYYWAYGTLAAFRAGGSLWNRWNTALKEVLLPAQNEDGSWPAVSIYGEFADDHDRSYATALSVMMMEVYYRYTTPTLVSGRSQKPNSNEVLR